MRLATQIRLAVFVTAIAATAFVGYRVTHRAAAQPQAAAAERMFGTRPSQYWFEQRAFPGTTIPVDAYEAALQQALMDREEMRLSTSAGVLQWQFAGPDNIGGRITSMAVPPGGATIYVGSANGGVFKSTDSGGSFNPVFDEFSAFSIGAITLDPSNPNIVYVGTGESNPAVDTYDGNGVYRSTDAGATWEHLGLTQVKRINRIVVDPLNPQRILVAGAGSIFVSNNNHGIWRTEDGGLTWEQRLFVDNSTYGADIIMNPVHPESLFCSMWDFGPSPATESAIYRSINNGTNWTRLGPAEGLPASNDSTDRIALAYAPSNPSTIYAQIIGGSALNYVGRGMYRSTDGGASWVKRSASSFPGSFGGFGWYFGTMAVDPFNADKVYALGVNFMRSTDGGVNWGSLTNNAHVDNHAVWINPVSGAGLKIYLGNDGGFFRTTNGGTSWIKGGAQAFTQFYAITVDPSNAARQMGGTQDNNSLLSGGTPSSWTAVLGGDGFYCVVDHTNPNVVFTESQFMSGGLGPLRSTTGGGAGTYATPSGFNGSDRYNWNSPFVMDPSDHNVLLAGSNRVYKSTNNGVSYSVVSGDLAFNPATTRTFGTISTISISPIDPQTYYTGSSNGKVYRSIDGGASWTDKTLGLPVRNVTRVTADAFDANTVYCSLSGFNGSNEVPVHVYKSINQGDTWVNVSGDLPNAPVNHILVDNLDANRLYAGTDLGVYTTQNGGTSWYPLGQGLPFQAVHDLYLHTAARVLFAGTHGRSMWKLDLTQLPVAVGDAAAVTKVALSAPSPNPSRGEVSFALTLPSEAKVALGVFDAMGRRVRSIHGGTLGAGRHTFRWDGRDAAGRPTGAGVYFVRAEAPGGSQHQRIVRIR